MNRSLLAATLGVAALGLAACASLPMAPPQASLDNIQSLRAANLAPMRVGEFVAGPGRPKEMDRRISVRANTMAAPGGSFARYLGDTIAAELNGAGTLDPKSDLVLSGVITDSHVESMSAVGKASLAARFTLRRGGKVVFEKTLSTKADWDSNFMAVVAVPDAFNHYTGLFRVLATQLFADPDFRAAARP
jgi:hypothetical protein